MDIFYGTLANAAMVVAGSLIGLIFKKQQKLKRIGERCFQAFGLFVMVMGIQAVNLNRPLYYLACLIIGIIIGEALDIDAAFSRFANWIQKKFTKSTSSNFAQGFVEASLLFCIGSMTFLGALESGIEHTHTIYLTKGVLDGISAIGFAMVSGISATFSAVSVLVYQGLLTLGASFLAPVLTEETIAMCVSVGSLCLIGIGLNMLKITKLKVANFLPAMFIPMVWQAVSLLLQK